MARRKLKFTFQEPGLVEAVAFGPGERRKGLVTEGYRDFGIPDLMIDLYPDTGQPYCFMSLNFDKAYPAVIWGLRVLMADELFDVPQAALTTVPLHEAFSWAYAHFILEDGLPTTEPVVEEGDDGHRLAQRVLRHSLSAL